VAGKTTGLVHEFGMTTVDGTVTKLETGTAMTLVVGSEATK
jgi:hypothetical protein